MTTMTADTNVEDSEVLGVTSVQRWRRKTCVTLQEERRGCCYDRISTQTCINGGGWLFVGELGTHIHAFYGSALD